ncbi:SDR family oxidoreductase [Solitalea koreensis]|uniref:3-oxoacyl-[acyl-carrier protein] reductase n=1 Tax=Solitalea koreensis TaxID=543615 RepID=A0A521BD69_9SPHI|nr:SDR family oxidoreductase [Solitalea koreensis]SMO45036.1 3-oxoacyl-[acyl-carrier protein] reductase [Solitalea koreensis]
MDLSLIGKNALVGGSSQGIGKAAAIELALLGANVILLARNEQKLQETLKDLDTSKGQSHSYIQADFSNPVELKSTIERYFKNHYPIHILVNNTGGPAAGPVSSANIDEFLSAFNNHLVCNHILAQTVIPSMKAEKYGRIINVISTSVKQPIPGLGVSNTIRGAVANWSKTLAGELASFGITVNNVLPGSTNTVRLQAIFENKAQKTGKSVEEIKNEMIAEVPAGRIAEANEIANAIAFLASPAASYINGINVPVDGGRTACL